jgi:hypothetical protein
VILARKPYIKVASRRSAATGSLPGIEAVKRRGGTTMGRILLKLVAFLVVFGALAIVAFGYIGDLSPDQSDVSEPVNLNAE